MCEHVRESDREVEHSIERDIVPVWKVPFRRTRERESEGEREWARETQGYLAYEKPPPPKTLQQDHAQGPMGVLGGGAFSYERGTPEFST